MFGLGRTKPSIPLHGVTHCGPVREVNEDAIDWWRSSKNKINFGVLADGMGGHAGGEFASKLAIQAIKKYTQTNESGFDNNTESLESLMSAAVKQANQEIYSARQTMPEYGNMGTTVVFVGVWQGQAVVIHVGDSRCYLLEGNQSIHGFEQITRDDSVVQAMLEEGVINEADVPNIPYRNKLTNALGIKEALEFNLESRVLHTQDTLLLCSDGFYQAVEFKEVSALVRELGSTAQAAEQLLNLSLENQTDDNTSVLLIGGDAA